MCIILSLLSWKKHKFHCSLNVGSEGRQMLSPVRKTHGYGVIVVHLLVPEKRGTKSGFQRIYRRHILGGTPILEHHSRQ